MIHFTISIPPRTKKNSQRVIVNKGRVLVIPSKLYKEYEANAGAFMPDIETIDEPVNIKALYYMPSKRRVDLTNLHEALHDMLVHYKVIADDNSKIIVSTDGSRVLYDKENPRTEVFIERVKNE